MSKGDAPAGRASVRPTLKEVAKAAGVSLASASYAVNGAGSVGEATRAHVLKVAAELGYRPNASAKAMKTGRTHAIGLIVPDLTNPFFPSLAQVVIQAARAQGYSVLLTDTEGSPQSELTAVDLLVRQGVDGVVWFPIDDTGPVQRLIRGVPAVVLDRALDGYDVVQADYAQGGALAADHLLDLGHTRIGVITGPYAASSARQRAEAAIARIQARGSLAWTVSNAFSVDLEPDVRTALASSTATGIICGADLIAIGAMRELRRIGVPVPEQVSVIGFDDIPWAQWHAPALSTIEMPVEEMGEAAVERLLHRMANPQEPHRRLVFKVGLAARESTGPSPP
ncbi:LacI family DNA-binding transcriptional regulator [Phenylobacterium deserti]|uniref:LacI family transcriptional regulator n=1 Tax=Phenylobacterium deserti TaxID=1914756 RepID=A0A328ADK3_9CAUL|nr:LacI family DNA-binding transcriptional regulator [Phenylobacterium deserti]RAK52665.1 LacI family transcriptional regulator [Phenylobacterium deserti]